MWHGAGWTFVLWGGLHSFYLVVAHGWNRFRKARGWSLDYWWYRFLAVSLTLVVVLFAWVLFRAPNLRVAGRVFSSMVGQHGLTMSEDVTNPAKFPGVMFSALGVQFVHRTFEYAGYDSLVKMMAVMVVIVLFLPNSQQLLEAYVPALERPTPPGAFRIKLGWSSGLFLGGAFFWVVHTFYIAAPSPFLYFNF